MSLGAWVSRAFARVFEAAFPQPIVKALPFVMTLVAVWLVTRPVLRRSADRRFGIVPLLVLLGSPLGWLSYPPLLLPTLVLALTSVTSFTRLALLTGLAYPRLVPWLAWPRRDTARLDT